MENNCANRDVCQLNHLLKFIGRKKEEKYFNIPLNILLHNFLLEENFLPSSHESNSLSFTQTLYMEIFIGI